MNFGMIALYQTTKTKQKLCYMNTDSFAIHIKTENFYEGIATDVEE